MLRDKFTFSLLISMISSQLALSKSEINRFWSKFFQFLLNIFDLDFGEFAKKSSIIANWGRGSETVDVKLPDIMFKLKVKLQKMLSIKVEEEWEILVGSNIGWKCVNKIIDRFRCFILQQIYVKITKKKNFLWVFLTKPS